jgi:hypothetical protein
VLGLFKEGYTAVSVCDISAFCSSIAYYKLELSVLGLVVIRLQYVCGI